MCWVAGVAVVLYMTKNSISTGTLCMGVCVGVFFAWVYVLLSAWCMCCCSVYHKTEHCVMCMHTTCTCNPHVHATHMCDRQPTGQGHLEATAADCHRECRGLWAQVTLPLRMQRALGSITRCVTLSLCVCSASFVFSVSFCFFYQVLYISTKCCIGGTLKEIPAMHLHH